MSERIYEGSPAQEFFDLSKLYIKTFGERTSQVDTWIAHLGRLQLSCHGTNNLLVEYLQPCATHYEMVWSNADGFCTEDWFQHLVSLRRVLILERLGDV